MSKQTKEEVIAEAMRQARETTSQMGDAARKIWLAGLGAFAKANAEGGELFGKLMKQGSEFEAKARNSRATLEETVERASKQGKETWSKVEKAVTEQVKRSLDKLGVAGQKDLDALNQRIDQIAAGVRKAAAARASGATTPQPTPAPAAARAGKAAAKKATSKAATPASSAAVKAAAVKKASDAIALLPVQPRARPRSRASVTRLPTSPQSLRKHSWPHTSRLIRSRLPRQHRRRQLQSQQPSQPNRRPSLRRKPRASLLRKRQSRRRRLRSPLRSQPASLPRKRQSQQRKPLQSRLRKRRSNALFSSSFPPSRE